MLRAGALAVHTHCGATSGCGRASMASRGSGEGTALAEEEDAAAWRGRRAPCERSRLRRSGGREGRGEGRRGGRMTHLVRQWELVTMDRPPDGEEQEVRAVRGDGTGIWCSWEASRRRSWCAIRNDHRMGCKG